MNLSNIKQLDSLVCRITTADQGQGTGTIVYINNKLSYILTCYHVIQDALSILVEYRISERTVSFNITKEEIIYGDASSDVAVIIMPKEKYTELGMNSEFLVVSDGDIGSANLCGFPEVKNRGDRLVNVRLDKGRIDGVHFRTEIKLDTHTTMSSQNCKGFSGGPIYIEYEGSVYLYGIVKEYSDELDYFTLIKIENYNYLLVKNKLLSIPVFNSSVMLCNSLYKTSVKRITSMRACIGTDIELSRAELVDNIIKSDNRIEIVYGDPGVGKSVVLKKIGLLSNRDYFFFVSEDFDKSFNTAIEAIVELAKMPKEILVIIDGAEKIFEKQFEQNLICALSSLINFVNIKIIISIRKYSLLNLLRLIRVQGKLDYNKFGQHEILPLLDEDIKLISKFFPDILKLRNETIELLKNPFYLDMLISRKLNDEINNISNEYQIKDLLWESITNGKSEIKQILLNLLEAKLNSDNEYVRLDIQDNYARLLKETNVIIEDNLHYKFSHDKFEDISAKKYFDFKKIENDLVDIIKKISPPLSWGRAFKLWIKDRLTNNEIENISKEIDVIQDSDVSYFWKWNILEAIYESKYFYDYLKIKEESIVKDITFVKKMYEIIVSCDLTDLEYTNKHTLTEYEYFTIAVGPSFQIYTALRFFNDNRHLINDSNFLYIARMLSETKKISVVFQHKLLAETMQWVLDFSIYLMKMCKECCLYKQKEILKHLCQSFICYASLSVEKSNRFFDELCYNIQDHFNCKFAESLIFRSENINEMVGFSKLFLEMFYDKLIVIFERLTLYNKESSIYLFEFSDEALYELNETFMHYQDDPQKTIIFNLFDINFNKTFEFLIDYINNKIDRRYSNNKNARTFDAIKQDFIFANEVKSIIYISNNYSACLKNGNSPVLIRILAKAMMQKLLELDKNEDISNYIVDLIEKSNNLVLISIAVNIVMMRMDKYYKIFAEFSENYFIRILDIEFNRPEINLNIDFPSYHIIAEKSNKSYYDMFDKKYSYDMAFLQAQKYKEIQMKMFSILDNMEVESNTLEIRNFAVNHDIRRYKIVDIDDEKITFSSEEVSDTQVLNYQTMTHKIIMLNQEFQSLQFFLVYDIRNISEETVKILIKNYKNGKYSKLACFYNLDKYVELFYLKHPNTTNRFNYKKILKRFFKNIQNNFENNIDNSLAEKMLQTLATLDNKYLSKHEKIITIFLFKIVVQINYNSCEIKEYIIKICNKLPNVKDALLKILIAYCHFDKELFDIHQRRYENKEDIYFKEINPKKDMFENKIISSYQSNNKFDVIQNLNPENFLVLDIIIALADEKNYVQIKKHILKILEMLLENKNTSWHRNAEIAVKNSIVIFFLECMKNNWDFLELKEYLFKNYECFHEIIMETLQYISAYVQDGNISPDDGWNIYTEVYEILFQCPYKSKLFSTIKSTFVEDIRYQNVGYLLMGVLLIGIDWNMKLGATEIRLLNGNEVEYINWIMKFMDSSIGVMCFAMMCNIYPQYFSSKDLFDNKDTFITALSNPDVFQEKGCTLYYEKMFEKIFSNYEKLNREEKNSFLELLTSVGCNAPSAFLLYLKRKIEY